MAPFMAINFPVIGLSETVALASVAMLGYLVGRIARPHDGSALDAKARRELKRASVIAKDLELVAGVVRKELATHLSCVSDFKTKLAALSKDGDQVARQELCLEAEQILRPTLKLASQLAQAYDQIRQQSSELMAFTEVRTDPLTGVSNRRALDEQLDLMFSTMRRMDKPFSIGIFDIDHFKEINDSEGHLFGDQTLQQVARLFDRTIRDTDIVARYGGEEFVVVMPQTRLAGACVFGERLRQLVQKEINITISGGISEAADGDSTQTLLTRADSALYSAKASGRNCLFQHDGMRIRPFKDPATDAGDKQPPEQEPPSEAASKPASKAPPQEQQGAEQPNQETPAASPQPAEAHAAR